MKKTIVTIAISGVLSVAITIIAIYAYTINNKVAYVRVGKVVEEYHEMKKVNEQLSQESQIIQTNLDTLINRYERYKLLLSHNPNDENIISLLQKNEADYIKYNSTSQEKLNARRVELTNGVLDKVNKKIQEYGEKQGYKVILGTTNNGSLLYGKKEDDLTTEIINILNEGK